jgi:nitroreductase
MTTVTEALKRRISIRRFLPTPVPRALLLELLETARWSPSGGNLQPWKVIAVAGAEREAVTALARAAGPTEEGSDPIYPPNLWEPYRSRRYKMGEDMYALLGIGRDDKAGRLAHVARNYEFFGAPVGLFFVIDRRLGRGQWVHLGMFMQSLALVAVERGLGSCMQEFWATLRGTLHRHFELAETDYVYCGMALGYPDPQAPVNRLRSDRARPEDFATLRGF